MREGRRSEGGEEWSEGGVRSEGGSEGGVRSEGGEEE